VLRQRSFQPKYRITSDRNSSQRTIGMPPSPPLAMSPTLGPRSARLADLAMAADEWSSTPERAIGCSLRPPEPGSSGGVTELEDGQLGGANLPHDAQLEAALHAARLHLSSARLHNGHVRPWLEPAVVASGSLAGHALGGRESPPSA